MAAHGMAHMLVHSRILQQDAARQHQRMLIKPLMKQAFRREHSKRGCKEMAKQHLRVCACGNGGRLERVASCQGVIEVNRQHSTRACLRKPHTLKQCIRRSLQLLQPLHPTTDDLRCYMSIFNLLTAHGGASKTPASAFEPRRWVQALTSNIRP